MRSAASRCAPRLRRGVWHDPAFRPTCWQALSESQLERKLAALRAYGKEVEDWPSPRSERGVRALAEYLGSQVSRPYAEAFEFVRVVLG